MFLIIFLFAPFQPPVCFLLAGSFLRDLTRRKFRGELRPGLVMTAKGFQYYSARERESGGGFTGSLQNSRGVDTTTTGPTLHHKQVKLAG